MYNFISTIFSLDKMYNLHSVSNRFDFDKAEKAIGRFFQTNAVPKVFAKIACFRLLCLIDELFSYDFFWYEVLSLQHFSVS